VKPPLGFVGNRVVVDSFITRNGPFENVVSNVADVVDLAMRRVHHDMGHGKKAHKRCKKKSLTLYYKQIYILVHVRKLQKCFQG
jgi:hypothetical protein